MEKCSPYRLKFPKWKFFQMQQSFSYSCPFTTGNFFLNLNFRVNSREYNRDQSRTPEKKFGKTEKMCTFVNGKTSPRLGISNSWSEENECERIEENKNVGEESNSDWETREIRRDRHTNHERGISYRLEETKVSG